MPQDEERSGQAPARLPSFAARKVFVAYPYSIPREDYRRPFLTVGKAFQVEFVFADEKITTLHILDKIKSYIEASAFGIYDITLWNANVALELGLAFGMGKDAYIAFDPSRASEVEVPSDLRGKDRLQYASFSDLETKLGELIAQELPLPRVHDAENQLQVLRAELPRVMSTTDGLAIGDIARLLGVSSDLAKVVVKPMIGETLRTDGKTRGTRYFLI